MKKLIAMIMAVMMVTMAFSACTSSSSSATTSESSATDTSSSESVSKSTCPEKAITVVVPFSAGGGTDLFARIVVDKMSKILGQAIEVVNMPGGAATVGVTDVVNSDPDGYKLGFCISTPLSIAPSYGETTYTLDDIQPIVNAYSTIHIVAVPADSDIKNVDDLIAYINSKGGVLSYAGSGTGNMQHLCLEEWVAQVNPDWDLTNVPYDGDPEEIVALMSHEVPFATLQAHGAKSAIEAGNIRPILIFGTATPAWMEKEGYDIQEIRAEMTAAAGAKPVGYKMGATSMQKRRQMNSVACSRGILFDYMAIPEGGTLKLSEGIHPKIEPEITFFLKEDLKGPCVSSAQVMRATDYIVGSIEIIDSRYIDFKFTGPDAIADNISAFRYVLGGRRIDPNSEDLKLLGVKLVMNGENIDYGTGAAVLGHPARAVAELTSMLYKRNGAGLKKGQFIMTGGITTAHAVKSGDEVKACFALLGDVILHVE